MTAESGLFQNPFLDQYTSLDGGVVSPAGSPLVRLPIPQIDTLLYKTGETQNRLRMMNVPESLSRAAHLPQQPILVRNEAIGIELTLPTIGNLTQAPPITTTGVTPVQGVIKNLPKNMREALEVLPMITSQRRGSKSQVFGIEDLKQIARNLDLPSTGDKDVLAARLRTAIIEYFNLPAQ